METASTIIIENQIMFLLNTKKTITVVNKNILEDSNG